MCVKILKIDAPLEFKVRDTHSVRGACGVYVRRARARAR